MSNSFGVTNAVKFVDETTCLTKQIEEWNRFAQHCSTSEDLPRWGGLAGLQVWPNWSN